MKIVPWILTVDYCNTRSQKESNKHNH
jgi:hypothetical protein